jgi:hypothetical protein
MCPMQTKIENQKNKAMKKSVSYDFKLSRKEVEEILLGHFQGQLSEKDADFQSASFIDYDDFTFNEKSAEAFLEVNIGLSNIPLRPIAKEKPAKRKRIKR